MIIRRKMNSVHVLHFGTKNGINVQKVVFLKSRERKCAFSLDFRPFGPSVLDGARSKLVLRDKGYAWALILWSSVNSKR